MLKPRVILDTNILISYNLNPGVTIQNAVNLACEACVLLVSQDTFNELRAMMQRFVVKSYVTDQESAEFLASIIGMAEWIKILEQVTLCRDPKNNQFLELAVNGQADYLVTGDQDLLVLHPLRTTQIVTTAAFTQLLGSQ